MEKQRLYNTLFHFFPLEPVIPRTFFCYQSLYFFTRVANLTCYGSEYSRKKCYNCLSNKTRREREHTMITKYLEPVLLEKTFFHTLPTSYITQEKKDYLRKCAICSMKNKKKDGKEGRKKKREESREKARCDVNIFFSSSQTVCQTVKPNKNEVVRSRKIKNKKRSLLVRKKNIKEESFRSLSFAKNKSP